MQSPKSDQWNTLGMEGLKAAGQWSEKNPNNDFVTFLVAMLTASFVENPGKVRFEQLIKGAILLGAFLQANTLIDIMEKDNG